MHNVILLQSLPNPTFGEFKVHVATNPINQPKNRFANILPCEL